MAITKIMESSDDMHKLLFLHNGELKGFARNDYEEELHNWYETEKHTNPIHHYVTAYKDPSGGKLGIATKSERVKWVKPDVPEGTKFTEFLVTDFSQCSNKDVYAKTDKGTIYLWGTKSHTPKECNILQRLPSRKSGSTTVTKSSADVKNMKLHIHYDTVSVIDDKGMYDLRVMNSYAKDQRELVLVPQVDIHNIKSIVDANVVQTEDGTLHGLHLKFLLDGSLGGNEYYEKDPFTMVGSPAYHPLLTKLRKSKEVTLSGSISGGFFSADSSVFLTHEDSTYVFSKQAKVESWHFNSDATKAICAATDSLLETDPEFISGVITSICKG